MGLPAGIPVIAGGHGRHGRDGGHPQRRARVRHGHHGSGLGDRRHVRRADIRSADSRSLFCACFARESTCCCRGAKRPARPCDGIAISSSLPSARRSDSPAENLYDRITAEAAEAPPGSDGVILLPHFAGSGCPDFNPAAKACIYGLTMGHQRKHISRAFLESIAFLLKQNLDRLADMGVKLGEHHLRGRRKSLAVMVSDQGRCHRAAGACVSVPGGDRHRRGHAGDASPRLAASQ